MSGEDNSWEKMFGAGNVAGMYGEASERYVRFPAVMIRDTLINTYTDIRIAIDRLYY